MKASFFQFRANCAGQLQASSKVPAGAWPLYANRAFGRPT
jgi:hypothetical protein